MDMKIRYLTSELYKLKRRSNIITLLLILYYLVIYISIDVTNEMGSNNKLIADYLYNQIFILQEMSFIVIATVVFISLSFSQEIYENLSSYIIIKIKSTSNYIASKIIIGLVLFFSFVLLIAIRISIKIYSSNFPEDTLQLFLSNFELNDFIFAFMYCFGYIIIGIITSILIKNPFIVCPLLFIFMFSELFIIILNNFHWTKWWMYIFPGFILSNINAEIKGIVFLKIGYISGLMLILKYLIRRNKILELI